MLSRLVTCSKNTPSEWRAGDAATRSSRPSRNAEIVAERPSPRPSIVSTAHVGKARRPRRGGRVRLVMIDETESGAAESGLVAARRRSAIRLSRRDSGPAATRSCGT